LYRSSGSRLIVPMRSDRPGSFAGMHGDRRDDDTWIGYHIEMSLVTATKQCTRLYVIYNQSVCAIMGGGFGREHSMGGVFAEPLRVNESGV
jgi:hypothetical protein